MHDVVFYLAVVWMTVLLVAGVIRVVRAGTPLGRLLALDMLSLILVGLLVLYAGSEEQPYFLDAALGLALLSFITTVAVARHHAEGSPFR